MSTLFQRLARRYILPPATKNGGLRLVFDIEANGFLDAATAAHCIVIADLDSDQVYEYGPEQITNALAHLARAGYLTGHNIQNYDLPLLQRLYGWAPSASTEVADTLVASRLILPNLSDLDDQVAAMGGGALKKLRGRYSVEAWGVRLGVNKVGADIKDFSVWTPELQARCVGDVETTKAIWHFHRPDGYSAQAMELEHRANSICNRIEADGVPFDDAVAKRLEQRWSANYAKMEAALREQFPDMNPSSRIQVAKQLEARGWIAEERTEKTKRPKITDELLEMIPQFYPEFASLAGYNILKRRIAQLSKGAKAWRKHVDKDGRLHGGIVHIGTPHSRASHFGPNLAQVPNPKRGTPFATECRALFRAPEGWSFVTADQATLQDRTFAHYLTEFDDGAYAKAFLSGVDQHWKGAIILDLIAEGTARDEQNRVHSIAREGAKSFRYGFLFGAQSKRAGQIINKITRIIQHADPESDLHRKFFAGAARPSEDVLQRVGRRALAKFEAGTPGLGQLRQSLRSHAYRHGWLPGLDGRRVPVRALHSTLNFIVTSAEAIICKRWLVQVYAELRARFRYGWDGDVVIPLWIYDEIACCCRPEIAAEVGKIMVHHAKAAGEFYRLKVPLDADFKIGRNWANELVENQAPPGTAIKSDGGDDDNEAPPQLSHQPSALAKESPPTAASAFAVATALAINGAQVLDACTESSAAQHEPLPWEGPNELPPVVPPKPAEIPQPQTPHLADFINLPFKNSKVCCPFHEERTPSCHIYPDHFHCFGCGAHGDAIDWLMMIDGLDRDAAITKWENWQAPTAQPRKNKVDTDTLATALRLWEQAQPIAGTLAERYLAETRGIDLAALPADTNTVLRFHPSCAFGPGTAQSCLLALFRDLESDTSAGIHRVALTPDAQKIDRKMLGRWPTPRAIKLWPAERTLVIGEGIETTLAAATCIPYRGAPLQPAWSAVSSGGLSRFPVIPSVERLIILVDHDANGEGQAAAVRCMERWTRAGRTVVRLTPKRVGVDFNDLVMPERVS